MSLAEDILEIFVEAASMTSREERLPVGFLVRDPLRQYAEEKQFHFLQERRRKAFRNRYASDAEFREARKAYCKAYYEAKSETQKAQHRARYAANRDEIRARVAARKSDPAYVERMRQLNSEAYERRKLKRQNDPAYLEHEREVRNAAYHRRKASK